MSTERDDEAISRSRNVMRLPRSLRSLAMTRRWVFLLLIFCFLFLASYFAQNPTLSFLKLLKISELIFLGWFVSKKGIKLSTIIFLLSVTVFYESILAIWQFIQQSSVGGFWWLWGERTFNSSTPFIAQAIINGQLILRSYGTFSHPNVLAGYLAIVLPLILFMFSRKQKVITGVFLTITIALGLIALFLSFSRTAWIIGGIALLFVFIVRRKFFRSWYLLVVGLLIFIGIYLTMGNSVFSRFQTLEDVDKKSLIIREQLNSAAIKIISDHPIFGVGLNNFLVVLPHYWQTAGAVRFYQPVHNIFLLIAAETGIIGFIIFITFIIFTLRRLLINHSYLMLLLVFEILVLGLFDHYFYTLQQGQLLMALVLGLAWQNKTQV